MSRWEAKKSGVYETKPGGVCVAMRHPAAGDEWNKNSQLIAAAPDLLEALKDLVQFFGIIEDRCDWEATYTGAARAAIARAEGKYHGSR